MLRSLIDRIERRYLERHGAVGIACRHDALHWVRVGWQNNALIRLQSGEASLKRETEIAPALEALLQSIDCEHATCHVSLSPRLSRFQTFGFGTLPPSTAEHQKLIRWRYEKDYRQSLAHQCTSTAKANHLIRTGEKMVAIAASDSALIKDIQKVTAGSGVVLQSARPFVACLPALMRRLGSTSAVGASALLYVSDREWAMVVCDEAYSIQYARSRQWLGGEANSERIDVLLNDFRRVLRYFSAHQLLENETCYCVGDDALTAACIDKMEGWNLSVSLRDVLSRLSTTSDLSDPSAGQVIPPLAAILSDYADVP